MVNKSPLFIKCLWLHTSAYLKKYPCDLKKSFYFGIKSFWEQTLTKTSDIFWVCHSPYLMSAFLSCQNVAHFMLYCLKLFEQIGKTNYEVFSTIELLTKCFDKKRNKKSLNFCGNSDQHSWKIQKASGFFRQEFLKNSDDIVCLETSAFPLRKSRWLQNSSGIPINCLMSDSEIFGNESKLLISWLGQNIPTFQISKII